MTMATVVAGFSMSLDGFIADPSDAVGPLFDWYGNGAVGTPWPGNDAPFTFVSDGVERAVAQAKAVAGDKTVGVAGPNVAQQCLNAGLIDELHVELVPVLLGEGIRFFDHLKNTPVMLDDPTVISGSRVTHLMYRVRT
jgi:dihydrofolate reductase